jgi:hypothetical protein
LLCRPDVFNSVCWTHRSVWTPSKARPNGCTGIGSFDLEIAWNLLVFWPYSVFGQNHLYVKDVANRDSTVHSEVRRNSKFPVSCPDDVSSRPDAYCSCSIHPDDVPYRPDYMLLLSRHLHSIEKLLCQLASVRMFQQHVRTLLSSRTVL